MKSCRAIVAGLLLAVVGHAETNTTVESPDRWYAAQAFELEKAGRDFDAIFMRLNEQLLARCDQNPKLRVDDQARALFGGLWSWARSGGKPKLQNQADKALHFIAGGVFQGYLDAGGSAALAKEELDRLDPNNAFDLDDMAATMLGARWMDLAVTDDQRKNRQWVERWASGKATLSRSLPKLEFGRLPPGAEPSPAQVRAVQDAVTRSLVLPD